MTERLWKVISHQLYLQSGYCGMHTIVFRTHFLAVLILQWLTKSIPRTTDINIGIPYSDNSRLIVHEWPGFEPGYVQDLQVIRDFITVRTDARVPPSERLHAIW
jgi:hypothetical protein